MTKSTRGPDNQVKRYLKRFPSLEDVQKEHKNLGPIRVQRKSLKEIQSLLKALPNYKNIVNHSFYECTGDAIQFGYEEYCIFYLETHIDNLPPYSETVVIILKEDTMSLNKYSASEYANIESISRELHLLLDSQVVEINDEILEKIISRITTSFPEVQAYLVAAEKSIRDFNFSWDEALGVTDIEFGYNPYTGKWDGSYNPEPNVQYFLAKTTPDSADFNALLGTVEPISKEVWDILPKLDLDGGAQGAIIYESEDVDTWNGTTGVDCVGSLIGIVDEISNESHTPCAIAFGIEEKDVEKFKKICEHPAPCISYRV